MSKRIHIHKSITAQRVEGAVRRRLWTLDDPGICLACGNEQGATEPDAIRCTCEACGAPQVYGADELLVRGWHHD